ncbi:MAG TPA: secretion protein, partial [Candidatus Kapabacteria bacterium]
MKYSFLLLLVIWASFSSAQDTFSIVAIDTLTKEIGSAGATCLTEQPGFPGAVFISDIISGHGAIHTQSYGLHENQLAARERM